jgi:cell surface protein SprA
MSLPLFMPSIGNIFGQSKSYGPMSPGLDFAFGFTDESYIKKALDRGWLITDDGQTSPAVWSRTNELNIEGNFELFKGFKVQLTFNRTDNRTQQIQFMYDDMPTSMSGSYTKTHCAIATALRGSNSNNGYQSAAFDQFLENIPVIRDRVEAQYAGVNYPTSGFLSGTAHAGYPFDPEVGTVSETSSDVLIPAFVAAYTGKSASKIYLSPFPSFAEVLPNWRITYDGLVNLGNLRNIFKSFTLTHAYQCTYSVGSYSSYLNWIGVDGDRMGFTLDALTGQPIPSSPYNISSVAITEKFAPLIGVNMTLKNEMQFNVEYRDQRTLTLNSSAAQLVEATQRGITVGGGYKIVGFNTFLKMKGSQQGISNDLTLNTEVSFQNTQALMRKIENNYTQATSGTRTLNINFTASYVMSKKITLSAYFDHQVNTPLVTTSSYPTTNTSYGISINMSLTR